VNHAVRAGKTVQETVKLCANMNYPNRDQTEWAHRTNVESAYLELGGNADPKKVGWNKDWRA
jgi:hypothetical protein